MKIMFILITLFFGVSLFAADKTVIAVADPWPPYIDFKSPKGGFCMEIVKAAYKTQGYQVEIQNVPWVRAVKMVTAGEADIIPNKWFSAEETKSFLFSNDYASCEVKVVKKKGDKFEYNGIKSLTGKKIGVIRGSNYGDEFNNSKDLEKFELTSMVQNVKLIIAGRIDFTLEDEIGLIETLKREEPSYLNQIEFAKNSFSKNKLYVAAGLNNPKAKELIDVFNKGLSEIKNNGTYSRIRQRYVLK